MEALITATNVPTASPASHHQNKPDVSAKEDAMQMLPPVFFQAKLTVGGPDDPLEKEADAMADKVMRMPMPDPISFSSGKNIVNRKCSECEEEEKLHRKESNSDSISVAPPIVHNVLNSSGGKSLDADTRSFMEPRFNYDFSNVKIHDNGLAAKSAGSINALAYTSGNNVVFNSGQYNTNSDSGKRLLAHELTHVVQQGKSTIREKIQKQSQGDLIDVDIMTADPAEAEALRQRGINLPAGGVVWNLPSPELVTRIRQVLTQNGKIPSALNQNPISNPVFVLHDTAVNMGSRAIARAASEARGPLGSGAAAFVPGTGSETVTRSNFFDRRRPTATEFEKGNDVLSTQLRLTNARTIWQNTNTTIRQAAMQNVLAGLGLTTSEITTEVTKATNELNEAITSATLIFSTGMWTVNEICNQITANSLQTVVNNPANIIPLTIAYDIMFPFFAIRNNRIASAVNVEIVQTQGSDCSPSGTPLNAYTPSQYTNVALLYLEAVLQAGRFPRITTHFLIDKNAGDHCDPRCYNVTLLYQTIGGLLTFPATTSFGITPIYGVSATDNVWWSDRVCGGPHP